MTTDTERDAQHGERRDANGHLTALLDGGGTWHTITCNARTPGAVRCFCFS